MKKSNKKTRKNTLLDFQAVRLVEGKELDKFSTEYSDDDLRLADELAQQAMKMPGLLNAVRVTRDDKA